MKRNMIGGYGLAGLLPVLLAACSMVPYEERHPEIQILDRQPDCEYESLGRLRVQDGHEPVDGQSREWAMRANLARAEARLRTEAAELGADAVIITRRSLSRERDGSLGHIDLRANAINNCP